MTVRMRAITKLYRFAGRGSLIAIHSTGCWGLGCRVAGLLGCRVAGDWLRIEWVAGLLVAVRGSLLAPSVSPDGCFRRWRLGAARSSCAIELSRSLLLRPVA